RQDQCQTNHQTSLFQPHPFTASIRRHSRRNPPRNRRCWTVFDRTSNLSFSIVRPQNRTSEVSAGFESTVPATFWGMSKNKSCSKWGVLPKLGVWAGGSEFSDRRKLIKPPTRCRRVWRRVGRLVDTTF
ncbi:unnamed protein product, partial [Prunus brigantina]